MQNMAACYQKAIVDCLIDRTKKSIDVAKSRPDRVVVMEVAANKIVNGLNNLAQENDMVTSPIELCTDNAAMIAGSCLESIKAF